MTDPVLHLAVRDWDYLMPLISGDVQPDGVRIHLKLRKSTPDLLAEPELDGGETSFSRYALNRAAGDDRLIGLPVFLMRGFRHRCILVRSDSEFTSPQQLAGTKIGLTGWVDSGNTWTRALLRAAGVDLDAIGWTVGPLTVDDIKKDAVGPFALPENVEVLGAGESLVDGLASGRFDAIFTPFMPQEMFGRNSRFRHLYPDFPTAEEQYYIDTGFVPGIHLLALKREAVARSPAVIDAVVRAFDAAKEHWLQRRRLLADTTPWLLASLERDAQLFGEDWMPSGLKSNKVMIDAFSEELREQRISPHPVVTEDIFADFTRLSENESPFV